MGEPKMGEPKMGEPKMGGAQDGGQRELISWSPGFSYSIIPLCCSFLYRRIHNISDITYQTYEIRHMRSDI